RDVASRFGRHGGGARVLDAAGDDLGVGGQAVVGVDGDAVHCHAVVNPDPDGGNLAVPALVIGRHPDARPALDAHTCHTEMGQNLDDDVLEGVDVSPDAVGLGQAHDGIHDELARAVPRELAAPVNIDNGCPVKGPFVFFGALAGR